MARAKALMGYGTDVDRVRLSVLSKVSEKSGSELIIEFVRRTYSELYGDKEPEEVARAMGLIVE